MVMDIRKFGLRELFKTTIFFKLVHGIFEIILGFLLFFVAKDSIVKFIEFIFSKELIEDSSDFFVNFLISFASNLSIQIKSFLGFYFVVFGIVNFWIALILITKKVKHYVYVEIIIALMILYQIYKVIRLHSGIILVFAIVDVVILWMIYKHHKLLLNN